MICMDLYDLSSNLLQFDAIWCTCLQGDVIDVNETLW